MKDLYHKQPLVISAKKQNEYHARFNEKIFYQHKNPHTTATYRLLSLSKKIKFIFLMVFLISIVLGIGYVNSLSKSLDSASLNVTKVELLDDNKNTNPEDVEKSKYETINDVTITSENQTESNKEN